MAPGCRRIYIIVIVIKPLLNCISLFGQYRENIGLNVLFTS